MKFLIIRFSSIGDIVLTTPVIRAIANASEDNEVHYITKEKFSDTLNNNPYISKIFTIKKEITEVEDKLKAEHYDYIIDLHRNLRSRRLIAKLGRPSKYFNKLNYEKWFRVNLKWDILPDVHIVYRYMDTIAFLGIKYDGKGLDYFLNNDSEEIFNSINISKTEKYNVFVIGGAHFTKQIPSDLLITAGKNNKSKIVLLGGKDDVIKAINIENSIGENCLNLVGKLSLNESATVVKYSQKVLTADTGLMHIAAAFNREIISIWGNTIPEFGMYALLPDNSQNKNHIFEVKDLQCRPCSKIGYQKCPKKHFKCMKEQNIDGIVKILS
ncbi:MAG: glycosyl transferase [Bacteroidetes bacterium]|nr:MAG: glycosyl transferase [Bacteroidota bacterium]